MIENEIRQKVVTTAKKYLGRKESDGGLPEPKTRVERYLDKIGDRLDGINEKFENIEPVSTEDINTTIEAYINAHDSDVISEQELIEALSNIDKPTDEQVQNAVNNYLANIDLGTTITMQELIEYIGA